MKKLLISLFALMALSVAAHANSTVCTGKNLLSDLEKNDPELARDLDAQAKALPYGQGLLWRVTKPGVTPSYIFGTMHLSDPRLVSLPEQVRKAFDGSRTLALEVTEILDPKAMAAMSFKIMQYTSYLDGTSLDSRLSEADRKTVATRVREHAGLPWNVARKIKPWALMAQIALPACEMARKRAGQPFLDMALGQRAKTQNKKLVSLESLEEQLTIMSSLPENLMIQSLVETARLGEKVDDMIATMIDLYLKGDTGTVWAMMKKFGPNGLQSGTPNAAGYAEFQEIVIDRRNARMADESEKLINEGGAFIAVGALHLPGPKGLLNILAQRGYSINAN